MRCGVKLIKAENVNNLICQNQTEKRRKQTKPKPEKHSLAPAYRFLPSNRVGFLRLLVLKREYCFCPLWRYVPGVMHR